MGLLLRGMTVSWEGRDVRLGRTVYIKGKIIMKARETRRWLTRYRAREAVLHIVVVHISLLRSAWLVLAM